MSVHVISWVLRHSPTQHGDRLVLISLADHAHADGTGARPSVATIAHEARFGNDPDDPSSGKSTAYESLRRLETEGHIRRTGRHSSGTTIWQIMMGEAAAFYRRLEGSTVDLEEPYDVPQEGDPESGPPPDSGPEPSLGTVQQQELDLVDGSPDGLDPESGPPALEAWAEILQAIRDRIRPGVFDIWLREIDLVGIRDRRELVLWVPAYAESHVRHRFLSKITSAARVVLGDRATVTVQTGEAPPRRLPAGRGGDRNLETKEVA